MQKIKRALAACAGLAAAAGLLAGCSSGSRNLVFDASSQGSGFQTELTFFGFKYEALNVLAIEDALHAYMDENPQVSISYDGIKTPAYFDVLVKRLSTGNGDDIFMVDHERALELGGEGRLADLSDLSTLGNFSDLAKSQMTAAGPVQYVPTSISAFGLYCNLDLLKEYGQKAPETLAELEAVCDFFAGQGLSLIHI